MAANDIGAGIRVSCFQRIKLNRDYRPRTVTDALDEQNPCGNERFALINALYQLSRTSASRSAGHLKDVIIQTGAAICPMFTEAQLEPSFRFLLRKGVFRQLVPVRVNFLEPLPTATFTFSANMDQNANNGSFIRLLIQLVGGYESSTFNDWFIAYCAPTYLPFNGACI